MNSFSYFCPTFKKYTNMNCLNCETDMSNLMNWDTLCEDFIECPNCGTKLVVEYDEYSDGNQEWCETWWLTKYVD